LRKPRRAIFGRTLCCRPFVCAGFVAGRGRAAADCGAIRSNAAVDEFHDVVPPTVVALLWILAITGLLHLLMIWGEVSLTHPTAHARLAVWEMVRGRYQSEFWTGIVLSGLGWYCPAWRSSVM